MREGPSTVHRILTEADLHQNQGRHWRPSIAFLCLTTLSTVLWIAAVATTKISKLDVTYFPLLRELPWTFWLGFALLLVATAQWLLDVTDTERFHFVLLVLWTAYLFIGPELTELNARVNDTYDWLLGVTYLEEGRFSVAEGFGYAVFPGYFFISFAVSKICGIGYYGLARFLASVLHLLRAVAIFGFASTLFVERRRILLASLLITAMLWMPGTHPSPHGMGFIALLFVYSLAFRLRVFGLHRYIIFALACLFAIMTHPVASLMSLLALSLMILVSGFYKRTDDPKLDSLEPGPLLVFWLIFLSWMVWPATYVFENIVSYLPGLISEPLKLPIAPFTQRLTPYRLFVIDFSLAYIIGVAIWVAWTILIRSVRHHRPRNVPLYPLLGILPTATVIFISNNAYSAAQVAYEYSIPFLVWFLLGHVGRTKLAALGPLIAALVLFPVGHYASEAVVIFPNTEVQGARFVIEKTSIRQNVLALGFRPRLIALANNPQSARVDAIATSLPEIGRLWEKAEFVTNSITTRNYFRYSFGDAAWRWFEATLEDLKKGLIYDNGDFQLYQVGVSAP